MRKIVVSEYITLDGVFEDPGGSEKTKYGGWSFDFWNEEAARYKYDELVGASALLLGRITYEGFAKAWPTMKDEQGFADKMNSMPKYVVSSSLLKGEWNNTTIIKEDVAKEIALLKETGEGNILVAGSATLVATLMEHDLVDEYRLLVHPVVLGIGRHLFTDRDKKTALKLKSTQTFATGMVALHYEPKTS